MGRVSAALGTFAPRGGDLLGNFCIAQGRFTLGVELREDLPPAMGHHCARRALSSTEKSTSIF
jgi:hypothetical protein